MAREAIPTWFFALVVVRRGDCFLVVREAKHEQRWFLPAGRVEPGETLEQAAQRETLEEAGIDIVLEGILKIQHTPALSSARVRAIYLARPLNNKPPKSIPDEHSLEARWVRLDELKTLEMRGPEVERIFRWVADGAPVYPLDLVGHER